MDGTGTFFYEVTVCNKRRVVFFFFFFFKSPPLSLSPILTSLAIPAVWTYPASLIMPPATGVSHRLVLLL